MKAHQLVRWLLELGPDEVEPRSYLRGVFTNSELVDQAALEMQQLGWTLLSKEPATPARSPQAYFNRRFGALYSIWIYAWQGKLYAYGDVSKGSSEVGIPELEQRVDQSVSAFVEWVEDAALRVNPADED